VIPKVVEALVVWLRWPNEIELDLLDRNIDIGLWHTLAINPQTGGPYLSSRRLLVLLDELPDSSRFKKASERNGRRSRDEEVREDTHNEIALLRASFHVAYGGQDAAYKPYLYRDPIDEKIFAEREAAKAARGAQSINDFDAQLGHS